MSTAKFELYLALNGIGSAAADILRRYYGVSWESWYGRCLKLEGRERLAAAIYFMILLNKQQRISLLM